MFHCLKFQLHHKIIGRIFGMYVSLLVYTVTTQRNRILNLEHTSLMEYEIGVSS